MADEKTQMPKLPVAGYDAKFLRERQNDIERLTAHYSQVFLEQPAQKNMPPGQHHWMAQYAATRERLAYERQAPVNHMNTAQSVYRFDKQDADN